MIRLGDIIESALSTVGITKDRVDWISQEWVGVPCGCEERKQKLNALSAWAYRVLAGKTHKADAYLTSITGGSNGIQAEG